MSYPLVPTELQLPSLLFEKYAWVDKRLQEMTYNYALTADNCEEFEELGLLEENWSWVDDKLEELYNFEMNKYYLPEEDEEDNISLDTTISYNRKRAETDISDYEYEINSVISRLSEETQVYEILM